MKSRLFLTYLCLMILLSACGQAQPAVTGAPSANASATATVTPTLPAVLPATAIPAQPTQPPEATQPPQPTAAKGKLYDPSIFVIKANGSWRDELAPGYFADYECEIYLHKIDASDNRAVVGSYDGVFWMKTTLDTSEFAKDLLGDAPVTIDYEAGAEAVADNLSIFLNTSDDKAWTNYGITGEDGNPLPLTQDTPVGKGTFVAVARDVYLNAKAQGVQGEKVDYSSTEGSGEVIDINYVIHVQPDEMESGSERKVTIQLSGEGFNKVIEGVMQRLPGYPEDVSDYLNSPAYQNSTWSRLQ